MELETNHGKSVAAAATNPTEEECHSHRHEDGVNQLSRLHNEYPMHEKDGEYFIDAETVSICQEGQSLHNWNSTKVLYEICSRCGWNPPAFRILDHNEATGFLFSVVVKNVQFFANIRGETQNCSKNLASDVFLKWVGFNTKQKSISGLETFDTPFNMVRSKCRRKSRNVNREEGERRSRDGCMRDESEKRSRSRNKDRYEDERRRDFDLECTSYNRSNKNDRRIIEDLDPRSINSNQLLICARKSPPKVDIDNNVFRVPSQLTYELVASERLPSLLDQPIPVGKEHQRNNFRQQNISMSPSHHIKADGIALPRLHRRDPRRLTYNLLLAKRLFSQSDGEYQPSYSEPSSITETENHETCVHLDKQSTTDGLGVK